MSSRRDRTGPRGWKLTAKVSWGCMVAGLILVVALSGRSLFVSPAGDDAADGSKARPWRTIAHAADASRPGDTISLGPGLYREEVLLKNSGLPGAPIRFVSEAQGAAVISGADPVSGWSRVAGDAPIYGADWKPVFAIDWVNGKPVESHPGDAPRWGRAEQAIADGRQLLPTLGLAGLRAEWSAHAGPEIPSPTKGQQIRFGGAFAVDTDAHKIYVWLLDGSDPGAHHMEAATRAQTFGVNGWQSRDGVHDVQVVGITFRYGASFPQRPVVNLFGKHNRVDRCVIEQMSGCGVSVCGELTQSVIRQCGQTGGSAIGDGFINRDDIWEDNCWKLIDRGWDAGGVKIAACHNGVFEHCLFLRNGGPGLWLDVWDHDVRIANCAFVRNEGSGLFIEISHHIDVDHCVAMGNNGRFVGSPPSWSDGGIVLAESENCRIEHCLSVGNQDGISMREQGPRENDTDTGRIAFHNVGHVIVDNQCAENKGYAIALWYDNGFFGRHPGEMSRYPTEEAYMAALKASPDRVFDPLKQGFTIDRNQYSKTGGGPVALLGVPWRARHKEFADLASWSKATGFDLHSRFGVNGAATEAAKVVQSWGQQQLPSSIASR